MLLFVLFSVSIMSLAKKKKKIKIEVERQVNLETLCLKPSLEALSWDCLLGKRFSLAGSRSLSLPPPTPRPARPPSISLFLSVETN